MDNRIAKPTVTYENVIRFPRMLAQNIIGYKVNVKEEVREGVFAEYSLPVIDNPISPSPIMHKEEQGYVIDGTFQLPNETYYSPDHRVIMYLNNKKVDEMLTTFNDNTKIFRVSVPKVVINRNDLIELEYYRDEVEVTHATVNKCYYSIEPVLDKKYLIGDHNIIR